MRKTMWAHSIKYKRFNYGHTTRFCLVFIEKLNEIEFKKN